ncbi:hypothetical protein [Blastococcus brunescens]|uniref:Uncharacterized protein n=1 Tax=Blastococcus brunescens TaxID=1564165 RepID=A0ABZ1B3X3_9ACTN|nr:hypothetical protein [Blastococcus sp. BMG 8361]WRL65501.1 hypothetical protein U6N30_07855 [Blastococcus sp. BMG 8361]
MPSINAATWPPSDIDWSEHLRPAQRARSIRAAERYIDRLISSGYLDPEDRCALAHRLAGGDAQ